MSHEVLYVNFCHSLNRTIIRNEIKDIAASVQQWHKKIQLELSLNLTKKSVTTRNNQQKVEYYRFS
jgi:hypothetical protein